MFSSEKVGFGSNLVAANNRLPTVEKPLNSFAIGVCHKIIVAYFCGLWYSDNMTNVLLPDGEMKRVQETLKEMAKKGSEDPIYFIDTFLYTFNPKVEPFHLRFKLFPFQS